MFCSCVLVFPLLASVGRGFFWAIFCYCRFEGVPCKEKNESRMTTKDKTRGASYVRLNQLENKLNALMMRETQLKQELEMGARIANLCDILKQ